MNYCYGDKKKEKVVKVNGRNVEEVLLEARENVKNIRELINKIEDRDIQYNVQEICITSDRIINTVDSNKAKFKNVENYFEYYLPVTLKIIRRYDDIENQRLTSKDSENSMAQTKTMIKQIKLAFESQLSSLYQSDIVDLDAEMKVLDMMLKSDGLNSNFNNIE